MPNSPATSLSLASGTNSCSDGSDLPESVTMVSGGVAAVAQLDAQRSMMPLTVSGAMPMTHVPAISTTSGQIMLGGASCAWSAACERLLPRNTIPYNCTKQATARAPVIAKAAEANPANGNEFPPSLINVLNMPR